MTAVHTKWGLVPERGSRRVLPKRWQAEIQRAKGSSQGSGFQRVRTASAKALRQSRAPRVWVQKRREAEGGSSVAAGGPRALLAHAPQLGLLEVETVLLLFPGLEVLGLLLPLQHLQLLLTHGLLALSLQPQLLHLGAQGEDEGRTAGQRGSPGVGGWDCNPGLATACQPWTQDWSRAA